MTATKNQEIPVRIFPDNNHGPAQPPQENQDGSSTKSSWIGIALGCLLLLLLLLLLLVLVLVMLVFVFMVLLYHSVGVVICRCGVGRGVSINAFTTGKPFMGTYYLELA